MKPKYVIFAVALLLMITEINAAYNYSVLVGAHELSFNTSSLFFETGYETTYWPVFPGDYGLEYSESHTTLKTVFGIPFLEVIVRDFKSPIPQSAQVLEINTLEDFLPIVPYDHYNISTLYGGNYVVREFKNESSGAIVEWPSNQTEIVILGNLPSKQIWSDVARSIKLMR